MVCHETYKDTKGRWLSPDEVEHDPSSNIVSKKTGEKVTIGPSESMSKSKKNTVDPEKMIKKVWMQLGGLYYLDIHQIKT